MSIYDGLIIRISSFNFRCKSAVKTEWFYHFHKSIFSLFYNHFMEVSYKTEIYYCYFIDSICVIRMCRIAKSRDRHRSVCKTISQSTSTNGSQSESLWSHRKSIWKLEQRRWFRLFYKKISFAPKIIRNFWYSNRTFIVKNLHLNTLWVLRCKSFHLLLIIKFR